MTSVDFEGWKKKVLKGTEAENLSKLEAELPGTDATYPLLVPDSEPNSLPGHLEWKTRIVLGQAFQEHQMEALRDAFTEVCLGEPADEEPLESCLQASRAGREGRVRVDLSLLKNVAEIRRLRAAHPQIETWVLVTEESVESDPEKLVGETIRVLTGVLGGCSLLEIRRAVDEPFSSIWSRNNVARLLAHESQLQELPDPVAGAGLFQELQRRLEV